MEQQQLDDFRRTWMEKPVLRAIYTDYYLRIAAACKAGLTLEIGGGSGNFKEFAPDVVSTDIQAASWLDVVADAQAAPFADNSFDNIVMLDVLHHIEQPKLFFIEALRILRPGGHMVLLEPAITPISWCFYHLLHPEPVDMSQDPLAITSSTPGRSPYEANQAIPTLLFGRYRKHMAKTFPNLEVVKISRFSFFAYPLSGGFRRWSLLPRRLVNPILRLEEILTPLLGHISAFRLFVVLKKTSPAQEMTAV